jgi:chemotaxis methyl-accepting protein methylase
MDPFEVIKHRLLQKTNIDLTSYDDKCVRRRIEARMRALQCENMNDYLRIFTKDADEVKNLIDALLINVTQFFRDLGVFEKISSVILPEMIERKSCSDNTIRAISAGCSSGEEAYSLAIILHEYKVKNMLTGLNIHVEGLDIDEKMIKVATVGIYSHEKLQYVNQYRKKMYFQRLDDNYCINEEIRRLCRFRKCNILVEPIENGLDLILCRNTLIYFTPQQQLNLLEKFSDSLNLYGYLVLGKAEIIRTEMRSRFNCRDMTEKFYQKVKEVRR